MIVLIYILFTQQVKISKIKINETIKEKKYAEPNKNNS